MLAVSESNIAVDNLLSALASQGVRVVRLGRPDNVRPELLQYCVDFGSDPAGGTQANYDSRLAAIRAADVVCSTCVSAG